MIKNQMDIPVVNEDGEEFEFELEMCCPPCARSRYGLNEEQFKKIAAFKNGGQLKVPTNIVDIEEFKKFVKTL